MKFIKRTDFLILVALLLVSIGGWFLYRRFAGEKPAKAEIYYGSQLVETISLTKGEEKRFSIPQNEHVVFHLYPDGSICFEESDCPDKVCIRTGRVHIAGESAACLPNEIILKIVSADGQNPGDIDLIVP